MVAVLSHSRIKRALFTVAAILIAGTGLAQDPPQLDTASWQYWTVGFGCLSPPQILAPAPGVFEQSSDGLRAYSDGYRSCDWLHYVDKIAVLNKTVYMKWKPDGAGSYMGINIYFYTANAIPTPPDSAVWHVSSSFFTTHHSFNGSIVVQDNVWYYSRIVFTDSTMTAYTAQGNYDDLGGQPIDQNTIPFSTATYNVRPVFGFFDQYASTTANLTIGEFRIVGGPLKVTIDIKPGSDPNSINLSSAGAVPVAILSSPLFDARTVDPASVSLAGARVKMVGKSGKLLCGLEDVNSDGVLDMVCQVLTAQFMIEVGESTAVLEAMTLDGQPIRGEDSIRIVPD